MALTWFGQSAGQHAREPLIMKGRNKTSLEADILMFPLILYLVCHFHEKGETQFCLIGLPLKLGCLRASLIRGSILSLHEVMNSQLACHSYVVIGLSFYLG